LITYGVKAVPFKRPKQAAEKLPLEGHGFSRAARMIENSRAFSPEVRFFTIRLRDPLEKAYLSG
jgi:hypothetical protein